MQTGTKQVTQLADIKVAMNPHPVTNLKMIHPKLTLTHLEASLNRGTGKPYPQQLFQRNTVRARHHIRDKVFHFLRIKHITGDNKVMYRPRQTIVALFAVEAGMFDFPYNRPILSVLDMKLFPFLLLKYAGINQQIPQFACRQRLAGQARETPLWTSFMEFLDRRPYKNLRLIQPAGEVRGNFPNIVLTTFVKAVKKRTVSAIELIERPGEDTNAVPQTARNLFKSYVGLLAIAHLVRNTCRPATLYIFGPLLRQVQITIQNDLEITRPICYMDPDDTVVCLAAVTAPGAREGCRERHVVRPFSGEVQKTPF